MPSPLETRRQQTLQALDRLALDSGPVMAMMQCDASDPEALIKVLAESPVLAGRVMGVANSAGSSAVHKMDTIDRCVRHLGAKQARTVALTMAMQLMVQDIDIDEELVRALWVSATTKACAAQLVAEYVSPEETDKAYSLGLLQDIALPVLLALAPNFFKQKLASNDGKTDWTELERSHFGIDHAELGAMLLQRWNAPTGLIKQIARHHAVLVNDDMAWVAEMPCRFAGLLPHLQEKTTKTQRQTLAATHTRFLNGGYTSIDTFLKEVHTRVKRLGKAAGGPVKFSPEFIQQITATVAEDTFALAAQVGRLDRQLSQQVDALAHSQEDALSDPLTGLLNRRGFDSFGRQMLAQAHKAGLAAACLVLDLDDFKPVNDEHGHAAGDLVLQTAAELLRTNVASGDLVARMGGDEFAILIVGDQQGDAHALAQRLHALCNGRPIKVSQEHTATLTMSIGGVHLTAVPKDTSPADLLDAADKVMYRIKRNGKAGLNFEAMSRAA